MLGGGAALLWLWVTGAVAGMAYLALAGIAILFSIAGRWIVLGLIARPGLDEPGDFRTGNVQRLRRPDGAELQVESYGPPDAPPIVLAPGWGIDSTEFYYLKRQLADRFRLITWDPRGLGTSGGPDDDQYSLERMAGDLDAVVTVAGERPVLIVGHSLGGMILLTFYRKFRATYGPRVLGLVLANTTFTHPLRTTTAAGVMQGLERPLLRPLLSITIGFAPVVRLMNWLSYWNGTSHLSAALSGFAGHQTRGQLDFAAWFGTTLSPAVVARGYLAALAFEETTTLDQIRTPTLIITADTDRVFVPESSRSMHRSIEGSELIELGAGHLSLLEQHEKFCDSIAAFHARCVDAAALREPRASA
jgi:pimeloyl-ACP methyl ester carboxylesterase